MMCKNIQYLKPNLSLTQLKMYPISICGAVNKGKIRYIQPFISTKLNKCIKPNDKTEICINNNVGILAPYFFVPNKQQNKPNTGIVNIYHSYQKFEPNNDFAIAIINIDNPILIFILVFFRNNLKHNSSTIGPNTIIDDKYFNDTSGFSSTFNGNKSNTRSKIMGNEIGIAIIKYEIQSSKNALIVHLSLSTFPVFIKYISLFKQYFLNYSANRTFYQRDILYALERSILI